MPIQIVNGAHLKCSMGVTPSALAVLPLNHLMSGNQPSLNNTCKLMCIWAGIIEVGPLWVS